MRTPGISQYFVVCFLLFATPFLQAGVADSSIPEGIPGVQNLTAETLIILAQSRDDLVVIDTRLIEDRKMGYIEQSISLPDIETNCETLGRLVPDPYQSLAFYCNGVNCSRSAAALTIAADCNYRNLYWFKGGFQEWQRKEYPYMLD